MLLSSLNPYFPITFPFFGSSIFFFLLCLYFISLIISWSVALLVPLFDTPWPLLSPSQFFYCFFISFFIFLLILLSEFSLFFLLGLCLMYNPSSKEINLDHHVLYVPPFQVLNKLAVFRIISFILSPQAILISHFLSISVQNNIMVDVRNYEIPATLNLLCLHFYLIINALLLQGHVLWEVRQPHVGNTQIIFPLKNDILWRMNYCS